MVIKNIILFLFISLTINAQISSFSYSIGSGSYSLDGVRNLQNVVQTSVSQSGIPVKIVDDFPARFFNRFEFQHTFINNVFIGVSYYNYSTGGKIHYKDYSGEFSSVQKIKMNSYGILAGYISSQENFLSFFVGGSFYIINTDFTIDTKMRLYTEESSNMMETESSGFTIEPFTGIQLNVLKPVIFKLSIEYLADLSTEIHKKDDENAKLLANGQELKADWNGLQYAFCVGIQF